MRTFGTATLRIKDGDGCVVGANARDDAVRADQVVRLALEFLGGLQKPDVPVDARARIIEKARQEVTP